MATRLPRVICLLTLALLFVTTAFAQQTPRQPLINQPVMENQLTTLRGNTHPLARPQFDIGAAPPNLPMHRMLLVLKRSPQEDAALLKLLDDQQDKASPNYHKWLTPDEFGTQFGATDQDVQQVSGWLQSHGFQVNRVTHGRSVIEFSGVESQVETALHTQIHSYLVNGQQYWANASDPQIPVALAPAVAGVLSLNSFPAKPMLHVAGAMSRDKSTGQITPVKPVFTLNGNCGVQNHCYGVGPYDFATIYNVAPLWNATPAIDGTGQTIAIVGETDINPQDIADFRNFFGLPPVNLNVIHDGPAPGILSNGEETESDLDVEWSSAVAKGATIDFVVSQSTETTFGIDLSALYIIDNNLAPVMSESYGFCELGLGTAGNQGFNTMWEQAAAQGITVMISAGDNGSAGCDDFNALGPARFGLQVNGFASTPFNVAVGGTDFYDLTNANLYWNNTNAATTQASAISYIPETTWDDSCTNPVWGTLLGFSTNAETRCNDPRMNPFFINVIGGSGGKSNCTQSSGQNPATCSVGYSKPSWQVAPGMPADGVRDLPDVSLFAASGSPSGSFYIVCQADQVQGSTSCNPTDPNTQFLGVGGTSASAPAFAGVMALVNQQVPTPHGQGNANYVLYKLAAQQNAASCNSTTGSGASCVFNDVTTGTIAMPCAAGSPNCTVQTPGHAYGILSGYTTGTGYDLATGLGSVNVKNLVTKWNTASFRSSATALTLGPPTSGITHGQSVNVNISVAPGSGSGTPTGDASLLTSTGVGVDGFTLSNGTVSGTTTLLPGGTYTVTAHYAGDSVFGGSDSSPVSVTVGRENSSPHIELVTFDWNGNLLSNNATTAVYGTPNLLRVDVFGSSGTPCLPNPMGGAACPSGTITLTDNSSPLDAGTYALNSQGYTEDQTVQLPGGNDSVKAQYAGDSSFNASSATKTYSITPAVTGATGYFFCGCAAGVNYNAYAVIQSQSSGAIPTGTVTFYANGNPIPGTVLYSSYTAGGSPPTVFLQANLSSSSSPFPIPGYYTLSASYSGDSNYQPATSGSTSFTVRYDIPTVNLQASPNPINAGSSTNLTATILGFSKTIAPTGTISFTEDNAGTLSGTVSYATVTDPTTGNLDLKGTLAITPGFTDGYFANYSGDANYPAANNSAPQIVTVTGNDFVLKALQNSATIPAGGYADYQFLVGVQSNSLPVSFGSSACSGLPTKTTCSVSPDPASSTGSVFLRILTTAPHYSAVVKSSARNSGYLWLSLMPLSAILLITYPLITYPRRRNWRPILRILLTGLLLLGLGCGGGGGSGGGGGGGTPPAAPTSLTATVVSSSQINLGWFPSAGATSYTVYRSTTNGFTPSSSNQIASTNQSSFYPDSAVSPSTTYYYLLKAANSSGPSGPSNQASGTTPAFDPGTPAGTYNITVTATSGAISHNVNLTLVVQ